MMALSGRHESYGPEEVITVRYHSLGSLGDV
jgi:hypothetical protein